MTPKSKAEELIVKMYHCPYVQDIEAKRCSIIAVEELIELARGYDTDYTCDCGFYQKVLTELKEQPCHQKKKQKN